MKLLHLYLHNFRNYSEAAISFSPGINVICGDNAQGKTNLLEAIHVLMTGRSFRTHHLSDLIRFGASSFYLEAHFIKNEIEQVLKMTSDGIQRKILLNATPISTLSSLFGILIGVILSPEDNELIKGNPSTRRQFLDFQIAKANPLYLYHLSRYVRAMKQRNHLLRKKEVSTLGIWEEEMAVSASYITLERQKATLELNEQGHPLQKALSGDIDHLYLHYKSSALQATVASVDPLRNYFLSQFIKYRKRELELGSTLVGPHRDDLTILLQQKEVRLFASEGQQRSCVASLRLAEWSRLQMQTEETPLMCIDDVGISLDRSRETHLYSQLKNLGQVFLTSPRTDFPLPEQACCLRIRDGKVDPLLFV